MVISDLFYLNNRTRNIKTNLYGKNNLGNIDLNKGEAARVTQIKKSIFAKIIYEI